jgi:hypothetical protein
MSTIQQSLIDQKQPTSVGLDDWLDRIGIGVDKVVTIWDKIQTIGKSPEVTVETPRAGSPEGVNVQNVDPKAADRGADTITKIQQIYDQVKGLFGLGYPSTESQPTAPVTTEAGSALPFGLSMGALAVIGLVILFIAKK